MKRTLFEVERKLQVARCAVISAHYSALAKVEEAGKCRKKLKDAVERLGIAQVAASKARDVNKIGKKEAFKLETDSVSKLGSRRDEAAVWTKY